eukprot:GHVU01097273.1.p1 GENE.GHVU01097273.1~~GHVU01097273.1.p1  ORF type:complete len:537 (+),score=67.33 GHVU01097273.1:309-1919(+)
MAASAQSLVDLVTSLNEIGRIYDVDSGEVRNILKSVTSVSSKEEVEALYGRLVAFGKNNGVSRKQVMQLIQLAGEIYEESEADEASAEGGEQRVVRGATGQSPASRRQQHQIEVENRGTKEEEEDASSDSDGGGNRATAAKRSRYRYITTIKKEDAEEWEERNKGAWLRKSGGSCNKSGSRPYKYFMCNQHDGCTARLRTQMAVDGSMAVGEAGKHRIGATDRVAPGVPAPIRPHVRRLSGLGLTPYSIKCKANETARDESNYTGRDATTPQVRNFLKAEARRMRRKRPLHTLAQLQEWAEEIGIAEGEQAWEQLPRTKMFVPPGGVSTDAATACVVLTTKALLENAAVLVRVTLFYGVCIDGTYKLHRGGWTLLVCGCVSLNRRRGCIVQSFRPLAVAFAKSESEGTYSRLLRATADILHERFGITFRPVTCLSDHSHAAANGARAVFPSIIILSCYPHVARNAVKKRVFDIIRMLRRCSNGQQFQGLLTSVVASMVAADCFSKEQLDFVRETCGTGWGQNWFVGASGTRFENDA